jgi:hypothetical protein
VKLYAPVPFWLLPPVSVEPEAVEVKAGVVKGALKV